MMLYNVYITDATSSAPPGKRPSFSASVSASSKNSRGSAPSAAAKAGTPIFIMPALTLSPPRSPDLMQLSSSETAILCPVVS
jgi:hypothetical protein